MSGKYLKKNRKKKVRAAELILIAIAVLLAAVSGLLLWDLGSSPDTPAPESGPVADETKPEQNLSGTAPEQMPSDSTAATQPADSAAVHARKILETMSLEEKIYQMFIVTQEQLTGVGNVIQSGSSTRAAIEKQPVGGIIYFTPNLVSREQTGAMISNIQSYSKLGLFIAVDEEGGIVSRVARNEAMGTTAFPAMGTIGSSGDPDKAYEVGCTIGTDIAALGFNLDFAPVADVNSNPNNPVIGTRAFHSDPVTAAKMVAACVRGFNDSGMLCTLKHFPGHGDTSTDSHYGEAEISKNLEELMQCELLPFISGIEAGAPFIMVGHITAPNVTDEPVPATLSHDIVTGLLREKLQYDGLIITDSMTMQAITDRYSSGEAAVKAIAAGVDIILIPQNLNNAVAGIKTAVADGTLTEERLDESVLRILETKIRSGIIPIP